MTRCRDWTAIIALLIVATALPLAAMPQQAQAATLRARLQHAKHSLATARHRLADARAALSAALVASEAPVPSATPTPEPTSVTPVPEPSASPVDVMPTATATAVAAGPTVAQLQERVEHWRKMTRRAQRTVKRLTRAYRLKRKMAEWERKGQWRPIIRIAAAKYDVSATRMHRMMMRESGGRRYAGTMFKGLFQYYPSTWRARWNPWRNDSIYDGSSQIFATAYAIHRGYGPSMWPNTYW